MTASPEEAQAEEVRTSHHTLLLFPEMAPLLRSVSEGIDAARERVWLETYIYRHDRLGRRTGEQLAGAAGRGVDVRLLYDPKGCEKTDPAFFEGLARRGVQVRPYRPQSVALLQGSPWPRDHSRNIVIDRHGYTGGAAWGDEWLPRSEGGHGWHDVCVRVEGPCVADFVRAYELRWQEALGAEGPRDFFTGAAYPDLELVADSPSDRNSVHLRHRAAVRRARRRVWIENSYFLPPKELLADLYEAAARGVDVRLILPGQTDLPILKRAARSEADEWLARGLKVYEYGPCMVHAKFALVDDDWGTVGTFNANVTSLLWANEVNLFVRDPAFVAHLGALFERDLERCTPLTPEALEARPLLEKAADGLAGAALGALEILGAPEADTGGEAAPEPAEPPPAVVGGDR